MSMFLLEGWSHRSCNLATECTHVCWLVWVGVCGFLCVGWYAPPEVRVDCCALWERVRVHVFARQRVLFHRRFRFDHVFGRPSRAHPNNTASLAVRQRPLPPRRNLPICSSRKAFARAPRAPPTHLNGKTSPLGSSSDEYGSWRAFFLAFSKSHLRRSQNRVYHHDHAVSIG